MAPRSQSGHRGMGGGRTRLGGEEENESQDEEDGKEEG